MTTDFIIGLIFITSLIGAGWMLVHHSNKVRQQMFDEMNDELEEEALQNVPPSEEIKEEQPKETKPTPKKRRGRSKKKNG